MGIFGEIDTCSDLAGDMQIYEPSDVVVGGFLWEQYDPEEIERAISAFTPANMVMTVVSKAFDGKTDREEKRYGVKYRESQIDSKLALAWAQSSMFQTFFKLMVSAVIIGSTHGAIFFPILLNNFGPMSAASNSPQRAV